ncbi:MAG: class I SAM-dependent methyltransferase, partial [Rhodospirillales bacterium]
MTEGDWDAHHSALSEAAYGNPALLWRWRHILRLLELPRSAPVTVLDVGCGDGRFAAFLKARHPNAAIIGVDGSAVGVAAAARLVPDGRFHCANLQRPDSRLASELAGAAAAAVCTEVLEHLDEPVACLGAVKGWLAPGGRLVITVPAGPMSASDRHFGHRKHYT